MNKAWFCLVGLATLVVRGAVARADSGLLVDYNFREGAVGVVHDSSGRGHDGTLQGGVTWIKNLPFGALSFNGTDGYIEGPHADLPIGPTGTLEFWCYPRKFGGGLIAWCKDGSQRLSLKYDISWCNRLEANFSNGKTNNSIEGDDLPADVMNRWSHMVLRFDSQSIDFFRNGKLQVSKPSYFTPDISGAVLRVGATEYPAGLPYFDGLMAGVKVYNRALGDSEIAAHFAQGVAIFKPYLPRTLTVIPRFDPIRHQLSVVADLGDLADLSPTGCSVQAQLRSNSKLLQIVTEPVSAGWKSPILTFRNNQLPVGTYDIACTVRAAKGAPIVASSVRWRLPKLGEPGVHTLNNLVAELLDIKNPPAQSAARFSFNNPRQGWVFVSCKAKLRGADAVKLAVAGAAPGAAIDLSAGGTTSGETMCFLPEGVGTLEVDSTGSAIVEEIVVHAIPELIADPYPTDDPPDGSVLHRGTGDYDFPFLEKAILPELNTLVGGYGLATVARLQGNDPHRTQAWFDKWNQYDRWKQQGRRWLQELVNPNLRGGKDWVNPDSYYFPTRPLNVDQVFAYWSRSEGFTDPNDSGIFADELSTEQGFDAPVEDKPYVDSRYLLPPYTAALRQMADDPRLEGRCAYIWAGANDRALSPDTRDFVHAVLQSGYKFGWEEYMSQPPTEADGLEILHRGRSGWGINNIGLKMERASALYPGVVEKTVFAPGIYSTGGLSHIVDPNLDYKVWMDVEMRYLATSPEFFGLDGLCCYPLSNADEEALRWEGQLFRHYAIEGKTDLLSPSHGFTWRPGIIQNADFDDGLQGWTVNAAGPDGVRTGELDDLGMVEGRMRRNDRGRHFLLTTRCAAGPNTASQILRNLVPGKLYCAKMLCTDYQCYLKNAEPPDLSAHLSIDGVEMIPARSFVTRYRATDWPKWFDSFRLVFRAKSTTAKLTISDWKADDVPGGPVGQQQLFNFVAVAPYFE